MKKNKTYFDKLMKNKEFGDKFTEEYQNVCIGERITRARYKANLTQEDLAKRINTTKSAISRYENANYQGYSIKLLNRIAKACDADLKIDFVFKNK
jgi:transcriptional regulator with XRE-family HTH domain